MNRRNTSIEERKCSPKIVIFGGGLGGLYAAKALTNKPVNVILIDRKNHYTGAFAWLLWSIIHVLLLINFRSCLKVMREWLWAYFKREGSTPLITEHRRDEAVPVQIAGAQSVQAEIKAGRGASAQRY